MIQAVLAGGWRVARGRKAAGARTSTSVRHPGRSGSGAGRLRRPPGAAAYQSEGAGSGDSGSARAGAVGGARDGRPRHSRMARVASGGPDRHRRLPRAGTRPGRSDDSETSRRPPGLYHVRPRLPRPIHRSGGLKPRSGRPRVHAKRSDATGAQRSGAERDRRRRRLPHADQGHAQQHDRQGDVL